MPGSDLPSRLLLFGDLERLAVRDRHTVKGLIDGLPREGIWIETDIDAGRRQHAAVGPDAVNIDAPLLAFPGPDAAAEPTVGLEEPRANRGLGIVLADHLRPGLDDLAFFLDRVFAANEDLVVIPLVGEGHVPLLGGCLPGPDEPVNLREVRVQRDVAIPFPDHGHLPLAVLPDRQGVAPARRDDLAV